MLMTCIAGVIHAAAPMTIPPFLRSSRRDSCREDVSSPMRILPLHCAPSMYFSAPHGANTQFL